jgi:hypothetical protein
MIIERYKLKIKKLTIRNHNANIYKECFLKFGTEVGVKESIVNANFRLKSTNNAKSEVRFKQLINHSFKKDLFFKLHIKTRQM